jgi:hypothetical protein
VAVVADEYRLENLSRDHAVAAGMFIPFAIERLRTDDRAAEAVLVPGDSLMNEQPTHGLNRDGLGAAFEAEEARKSNLFLEAQLLRGQRQDEVAAEKFAEAAAIEEALSAQCTARGLLEKSWLHLFSAASAWAQAGNFYEALALCRKLLARADLPEPLRRQVADYADKLRVRRAEWYAGLEVAAQVQA